MTNRSFNAPGIAPPFSAYSHGVEIPPGARWLHVSGQVGVAPDGSLEQGFEAQAARCLDNLHAILSEAGMDWEDVVLVKSFLTRPENVGTWRVVREATLGAARPASTLLIISGLAHPDWLIEVEVIAAKAE